MEDLRRDLASLEDLITERETLFKDAITLAEAEDISSLLTATTENPQIIIDKEMEKYSDIQGEIKKNVERQKEVLEVLSVSLTSYYHTTSSSMIGNKPTFLE